MVHTSIYFENFFSNNLLIKSLKKKLAIMYNIKAPEDMEITDTIVPVHFPNKIPEIIKRGTPNPSSVTHITESKSINFLNSNCFQ